MIRALLRERAVPGGRVLDLGSGDGALTRRLAEVGYRAVGVDADRERLRVCARATSRPPGGLAPSFVCADAACLPFRPAAFEAVVSNSVFEHLADPPGAFRESRRVLRPGGFLLINVPHRWGPREGHVPAWFAHWLPAGPLRRACLRLQGKDAAKWDAYISGIRYWTPASLRREMERAFEEVRILSLSRYEHPDLLSTRAQRWILALLSRPPTRWLGRLLVRAMGHVDAMGVAADGGRR